RRFLIGTACMLLCVCTQARAACVARADSVSSTAWNEFYYGRAVDEWVRGDFRAAANYLEQIDITPASSYSNADRAAFLLATAYLRLKDAAAFERVAARAGSENGSPYRRWIRYCALLQSRTPTAAPADFSGGEVMEAALLLESGDAKAALATLDATHPADAL